MTGRRTTTLKRVPALLACLALLAAVLAGCSSAGSGSTSTTSGASSSPMARDSAVAPAAPQMGAPEGLTSEQAAKGSTGGSAATPSAERLVVVNKTMRLQIKDVDAALVKVRDLASKAGGEIESQQVSSSSDEPIYPQPLPADSSGSSRSATPVRAIVTVRVPSSRYKQFVDEAAALGDVLFQSESSQDVTQQHVDMTARLANLRAEAQRLRQMFSKARSVKEMLEVERELSRVQGDIESMQAQVDYLERQAAMATVTLELAEPKQIVRPTGTDWGVGEAFTTSIRAFVSTLNGLIVILGPVLALLIFFVLPVALVVYAIVRTVNRRRRRRLASAAGGGYPEQSESAQVEESAE